MKTKQPQQNNSGRIIYFDVLRIFCVFSMMVLHVAASNWRTVPVDTFQWQTFNFFDGAVRFCVPVFIMISGAFFLDEKREITLKKLFKKNISRIVTAFLFWSFWYATVEYFLAEKGTYTIGNWFRNFFCGRYHLWFMFSIFALYLITPILRKFTSDKKTEEYFLILSFVFNSVCGVLKIITPISSAVNAIMGDMNIYFVYGYVGYFVLGHYLTKTEFCPKTRKIIYLLGGIGVLTTVIGSSIWSQQRGKPVSLLYTNFMPNVYFEAVAIFVFFKYEVSKIRWSEKQTKIITKLSAMSFGMYLFHDFVNIAFKELGFTTLSYTPILAVLCNSLIVFAVSLAVTYLIGKIPVINKYIM